MKSPALRLRLLLAAAVSVTGALAIAGIGISLLFSNHVERSTRIDLEAQFNRLLALVEPSAHPPALLRSMADPRFGVPFGGLYWQITDPVSNQTARSRSLWDSLLTLPEGKTYSDTLSFTDLVDPEGTPAIALFRRLEFVNETADARILDIVIAEDKAIINSANNAFRLDLARALVFLGIALVGAAWLQVALGLSPLKTIRLGVNSIRSGRETQLTGNFPQEVMPLVTEVNELMKAQEKSISFARERAADLAHGLKTSLTILNAEAQLLRKNGNTTSAETIEELTTSMTATIDHQLRLSRLRNRSRLDHQNTLLAPAISKVIAALAKTPKGRATRWDQEVAPTLGVNIDNSDLTELLGILLDNALKWSASRITISASRTENNFVKLTISDDGLGLSANKIAQLGERGKRLDEKTPGSGIGLAIAHEIILLNQGSINLAKSARLGGLQVTLTLPAKAYDEKGPQDTRSTS